MPFKPISHPVNTKEAYEVSLEETSLPTVAYMHLKMGTTLVSIRIQSDKGMASCYVGEAILPIDFHW